MARTRNTESNIHTRLMAKVAVGASDECWPWRGAVRECGQPTMRYNGHLVMARRLLYELDHEPIPVGHTIISTCGNKLCMNPAHHQLVAAEDIVETMTDRAPANAKLTPDLVRHIRQLHKGGMGVVDIARMYSLGRRAISRLLARKSWWYVD